MKYAVETGSGTMICIPGSIETGLGIRKLIWGSGWDSQAHTVCRAHKVALVFSK